MHRLTPHPFRHLAGTGCLVDGLWGHHIQASWLNQTHLLRKVSPNYFWTQKCPKCHPGALFAFSCCWPLTSHWDLQAPEVPSEQLLFSLLLFLQHHGPHSAGTRGTMSSALPRAGTRLWRAERASLCDQTGCPSVLFQLFSSENQGYQYKLAFLNKAIARIK